MTARHPTTAPRRAPMRAAWLTGEPDCVRALCERAELDAAAGQRVDAAATRLVEAIRRRPSRGDLDAFMHEYDLSSPEGVVLMCLSEALLRIPDAATQERLIRDKLSRGEWDRHLGVSRSLLVNASTWGLLLTGRMVRLDENEERAALDIFRRFASRSGETAARLALNAGMRIIARQFVMGRTIAEALERAAGPDHRAYRHSYDMLGEAALTADDVQRYFTAYARAIEAVGRSSRPEDDVFAAPSISIKLSALHPRYEYAQAGRVRAELGPRLLALAEAARDARIGLTLDAEEADRLELSLDVFETVFHDAALGDWEGLGLAVQAYQKRAPAMIDWLRGLALDAGRRIPLRLVKGAYWDAEVKRAQMQGLEGYPVFTRKSHTDVSYLACVRAIFEAGDAFYPQFATHNAHTLAYVLEAAGENRRFEFQRLHGMGEALYGEVLPTGVPCRVYAPVGSHEVLLPYLVRRLLENGANTSFVNRLNDLGAPIERVVADPCTAARQNGFAPHPRIPLPVDLYAPERVNSRGANLADADVLAGLQQEIRQAQGQPWRAEPTVAGAGGRARPVLDPGERTCVVGTVVEAHDAHLQAALQHTRDAFPAWEATPVGERAAALERAADLFESHRGELLALLVREGGKTIPDSLAELREAVDLCRYYAAQARRDFAAPAKLPGPTGEANELSLHGRGTFACISPWNFPLAIFTGQVAAALAAGNTVIAKPANQTPLVAAHAVRLLHRAGVPQAVLQFLPGSGSVLGPKLLSAPTLAGVAFTGSTDTARGIHRQLAERDGPLAVLIAETGGQNAMIVDSSALPEQVVQDALASAFNSAGQRCSALRVLFLQQEIADRVIELLTGAAAELVMGDPGQLSTDVGPVIDEAARDKLTEHAARMDREGRLLWQASGPKSMANGVFFPPRIYQIDDIGRLQHEVFGPILHVVRYDAERLDGVVDAINATGYGLTLGVHSRIDETVRRVRTRARVGNLYVNRNIIGAVVGVQPFGGEGLSGTGPKAGGPHYVRRFATERAYSVNTAAAGGNASLLAQGEE